MSNQANPNTHHLVCLRLVVILHSSFRICGKMTDESDVEQGHKNLDEDDPYQNLIRDLITRYKNEIVGKEDVDIAGQLDRVTEEVKELKRLLKILTKEKETA